MGKGGLGHGETGKFDPMKTVNILTSVFILYFPHSKLLSFIPLNKYDLKLDSVKTQAILIPA